MNEIINNMMTRRSCRSYNDKAVPEDILNQILEAGKYAASGKGLQSAVMVVVRDKDTIKELSKLNAAVMGTDIDPFYGANTIVIVFADSTVNTWIEDGSLVMGNLMNAAHSLGVESCWIHRAREVFDSAEGKVYMKKWGLDEKYRGIGNCILGYSDAPAAEAKPRKNDFVIFD